MKEKERCIYCGKEIIHVNTKYRIHLKHESLKDVYCCSKECFKDTQAFMGKDDKSRLKLYIILAVCIVLDLILMAFMKKSTYMYLPLGIIGISLYFWPYIMIRYRSYQRLGIVRTVSNLRKAGLILALLAIVFFFFG